MKCVALDEEVFRPLHRAAHDGFGDSPRESGMEVGVILPPVLECHEELILKRNFGGRPGSIFPLLVLSEGCSIFSKGCGDTPRARLKFPGFESLSCS
jgi:hypothetical protein